MTDRDPAIPSGHPPQHGPEQEPRPAASPAQDQGDTTEFLEQLAGTNTDGTAYVDASNIEPLGDTNVTDIYQGETEIGQNRDVVESYDMLIERELRADETDDVMEAIEEGMTYVPPIDPPTVTDADDPESIQVAAGFGVDGDLAEDEQDTADDRDLGEDDMSALVRRALRRDSSTSHLADRLLITTVNNTVIVRGTVDDLDDTDNIVAVISELPDVEAVRDETTVSGL